MNRLFIELYLDEDVDVLVADLLRSRGFTAVTTREAGLLHSADAGQLAHAASAQQTLLTHNRADFEVLHQQYINGGRHHAGIIIATRHPPYKMVQRLLIILDQITADEMLDQLRYI